MATYSGNTAVSATLTASTVDTVILTAPTLHGVTVVNATAAAPIYFTVSPVGGPNTQPTVGGTNCYTAASVAPTTTTVSVVSTNGVVVNLISSGTPGYSVEIR